jgi:hypothetical protein
MIKSLKKSKVDLFTIILLCLLFLGMASYNLGTMQSPVTNWQTTQTESFYVEFGQQQQIQEVYFWVKLGNASVTVYSGAPGNWYPAANTILSIGEANYAQQVSLTIGANTQYLKITIEPEIFDTRPMFSTWGITNPSDISPAPFVEISEICALDFNNQQIPIISITGDGTSDSTLPKLVDEQNSLTLPPSPLTETYFDEAYFVRAANNYLHGQIPFERTHPPLGKLIQAAGIAIFGDTPFGWRIMGVIFATLMIPLMYFLGKRLFGSWIGGFSAAFLLTFDFMHFTMARMATSDTYVVFFSLASQLFFLIYLQYVLAKGWKTSILPLFLSVLFFSFSFSTKWFALFAFIGQLLLLAIVRINDIQKIKGDVVQKLKGFFKYPFVYMLIFLGVAVLVYCLTYLPDLIAGDSPQTIFNLQFSMYQFHSTLTDPHVFQSPWYSWPLLFNPLSSTTHVPLLLTTSLLSNGIMSDIVLLGNPLIWWVGFACILGLTAYLLSKILVSIAKKRSIEIPLSIAFILVFFFFSWLPYILISRVTFIYHFYLAVPMLILAVTYFINKLWKYNWGKILVLTFFVAVIGFFILFYPIISGAPATTQTINNLEWFGSWVT